MYATLVPLAELQPNQHFQTIPGLLGQKSWISPSLLPSLPLNIIVEQELF